MPVRPVATSFAVLIARGSDRGFIDLIRPITFEEQLEEQRLIRDAEEPQPCPVCGRPSLVHRCDACLEKHRERTNLARSRRRDAGLCIFCGKPEPCEKGCIKKTGDRVKNIRAERRSLGLCESCGAPDAIGGYCALHRSIRLPKAREREARRRDFRRRSGLCLACGMAEPEAGGSRCKECRQRIRWRKRSRRSV